MRVRDGDRQGVVSCQGVEAQGAVTPLHQVAFTVKREDFLGWAFVRPVAVLHIETTQLIWLSCRDTILKLEIGLFAVGPDEKDVVGSQDQARTVVVTPEFIVAVVDAFEGQREFACGDIVHFALEFVADGKVDWVASFLAVPRSYAACLRSIWLAVFLPQIRDVIWFGAD
ncbi:hypothetical protein N9L84_05690 [Pseudomonas tohonis]|nr:hypothetical protein [Pseudomonas tohonis]UXY54079.1 hypothetical protein N9L84_05690 [Pseudomonas tohonis]